MTKFLLSYGFLIALGLVSCNSGEEKHVEANLEEIHEVMDTIEAKATYIPLETKNIFNAMAGSIQGSPKLKLEPSHLTDSSLTENYIEEAAITQVTSDWAELLKLKELKNKADVRLNNCTKMLWRSLGAVDKSISGTAGEAISLDSYFQYYETDGQGVYFVALTWLENLYRSAQLNENVGQKTKYNQAISKQLNRGDDLLSYLYDYQDYKPISIFSQEILEVIDCKNYELNVTQLKEVVIDVRKRLYHLP